MTASLVRTRLSELKEASLVYGDGDTTDIPDSPSSMLPQPLAKWAEVKGNSHGNRPPGLQALDSASNFLGSYSLGCDGVAEGVLVLGSREGQKAEYGSVVLSPQLPVPRHPPPPSPTTLPPPHMMPNTILRALRLQAAEESTCCDSPSSSKSRTSSRGKRGSSKVSCRLANQFVLLRQQQEKWAPKEVMEQYRFPAVEENTAAWANPLRLLLLRRHSPPVEPSKPNH